MSGDRARASASNSIALADSGTRCSLAASSVPFIRSAPRPPDVIRPRSRKHQELERQLGNGFGVKHDAPKWYGWHLRRTRDYQVWEAVAAYFETRRLVDDQWATIFDFLAGALDAHREFAHLGRPITEDLIAGLEHDTHTLRTFLDGLKAACGLPDGYEPRSER